MTATNTSAHPVDTFSKSHAGILSGLDTLARLPDLVVAAEQSRMVALATLSMFDNSVLAHHADEEGDLFPAVLRSSAAGEERDLVEAMIEQLTAEHRMVESLWKMLKPKVKHAAGGSRAELTANEVELLVSTYRRHAAFEEAEFLPLAREILGRDGNHVAALGLSLHLRHAPQPVGYI
jgi:hemerythrin-like domain-containing protein